MRNRLWPGESGEHAEEIDRYFTGERRNPLEVLIAWAAPDQAVGFVELSIRADADGCYSGRVGYVEGWYVEANRRGQGVGAALIRAAETWARQAGCTEMASDAEIGNEPSIAAHQALGFEETTRAVCFRKDL